MNDFLLPRFYRTVLLALYHAFDGSSTSNGKFVSDQIGDLASRDINPGIVRAGLQGLVELGLLTKTVSEGSEQDVWEFTPRGAEQAYELAREYDQAELKLLRLIDAAGPDATMLVEQNAEIVKEIKQKVGLLKQVVDKFDIILPGRRPFTLLEIDAVQRLLEQSLVRKIVVLTAVSNSGIFRFVVRSNSQTEFTQLVDDLRSLVTQWMEA